MATLALVVSIVALCVAAWSARSSHRSSRAALDSQHRAQTPVLDTRRVVLPDRTYCLRLRNRAPAHLDSVVVEVVPTRKPYETEVVVGISPEAGAAATASPTADLGAVPLGESRDIRLWFANWPVSGTLRLRCTCQRAGEKPWTVLVEHDFPRPSLGYE